MPSECSSNTVSRRPAAWLGRRTLGLLYVPLGVLSAFCASACALCGDDEFEQDSVCESCGDARRQVVSEVSELRKSLGVGCETDSDCVAIEDPRVCSSGACPYISVLRPNLAEFEAKLQEIKNNASCRTQAFREGCLAENSPVAVCLQMEPACINGGCFGRVAD